MLQVQWIAQPFAALTAADLYAVLQLRSEVFVVEQACVFQDMDGADTLALHLMGMLQGRLVAYARCLPPGAKYIEASVGRVLTEASVRGQGLGHELMQRALVATLDRWGDQAIRIGAQARLTAFYARHGFTPASEPYLEDGIPHLEMLRPLAPPTKETPRDH